MLRNLTKDEIIIKLRQALMTYANPHNWDGPRMLVNDANQDDCSGLFCKNGEAARQALLYDETVRVPIWTKQK